MAMVIVVAHTLEQAQLAIRWRRRRIIALPGPPNPNLRVLLSETITVSTGIGSGSTFAAASDSAISHIPRICEPIVLVILLLLLELERTSFHSRPIFVPRALPDVYWRVCAPAVAEGFPVFPDTWCASVHGPRSGVRERSREHVPQAKGRRRFWRVGWVGKFLAILWGWRKSR